jgi:hypothetical protein
MWCWGWREEISWIDRVRNGGLIRGVKEERHILRTSQLVLQLPSIVCYWRKDRKRYRSEGRRGIRRKQLLDDLKETTGYWKLKEEEIDLILWRTRFGRS